MNTRSVAHGATLLGALAALPTASAHGGEAAPPIPQWLAMVVLVAGVAVTLGSGYARRYVSEVALLRSGGLLNVVRMLLPVLAVVFVLLGLVQLYAGRRTYAGTGRHLGTVAVLAGMLGVLSLPFLSIAGTLLYASRDSFDGGERTK